MTTSHAEQSTVGWIPDDSAFAARLALVRQHMGWGNVKEAAMACGLPPESWRQWERDGAIPRRQVEVAEVISDRTGVDFDWLLRGRRRFSPDVVRVRPLTRRRRGVTEEYSPRPRDTRPSNAPGVSATPRRTVRSAA